MSVWQVIIASCFMHGSQVLTCGVLLTMCQIPNWSLTSASFSCSVVCHLLTRWPTRIMWASRYTWNIFIAVDHVVFWTVLSSFPHSLHTAQESGWAVCNAVSVQGGESKVLLDSEKKLLHAKFLYLSCGSANQTLLKQCTVSNNDQKVIWSSTPTADRFHAAFA